MPPAPAYGGPPITATQSPIALLEFHTRAISVRLDRSREGRSFTPPLPLCYVWLTRDMSPWSRELRSLAMRSWFALALLGSASMLGCGQQLDVGSDVLWTARFETDNFDEWTASRFGGTVGATPAPTTPSRRRRCR